jgi:hypothetical protein
VKLRFDAPNHAADMGQHDDEVRVRDQNGNKVLAKLTEGSSLLSRSRAYMGPSDWSNYTVESDVIATRNDGSKVTRVYRAALRVDSLRQQPDAASRAVATGNQTHKSVPTPGSPTRGTA